MAAATPWSARHQSRTLARLVYRQTGDGMGEQVRLDTWNPEEHTELFVAPRLAGD